MPSSNETQAGPSSGSFHSHTHSLPHTSNASITGAGSRAVGLHQETMSPTPRAAGSAGRVTSLSITESPHIEGLSSDVTFLASSTNQVLVQSVVQRLIKRVSLSEEDKMRLLVS
jgi:hypothetical protein